MALDKRFESFANVLKIVKGSDNTLDVDLVTILETNVDDVQAKFWVI